MDIKISGLLESLFDKHNSKFMDLVSADSETAIQNVDLVKNILRQARGLSKNYPFINRYLKDETVSLVRLTHHAGSHNVRMVTQFQGDPVIVDIPLDAGHNQAWLKVGGELILRYKGEALSVELTEKCFESLTETGWESFYFPSNNSRLTSTVLTEQSLGPGTYIKQKMMEMMESDPLFALDAFLSNGDIEGAFDYIEEQEMSNEIFKKRLAFFLVSDLDKTQISKTVERMSDLNLTALLDALSEQEISQLMSDKIASKDAWSNPYAIEIVQALITESSSSSIKLFQQTIEQLSLSPVPENVTAIINAEIANSHITPSHPGRRSQLKL